MSASRQRRPPTFFWQGLLIVLPVVVLAAVGLFSLRQDKILARHEANEHAQAIADEMAQAIWTDLTSARDSNPDSFRIDQTGQLIFPPPFSPLPHPHPLNPAELTQEQRQLWQSAGQMERDQALSSSIEAYKTFRDHSPPESFAAAACFQLGLLFGAQGDGPAAAGMFQLLIEKYPRALGESGLPLGPLAQLKFVELATKTTNPPTAPFSSIVESLCSNAVLNPSPVTPLILKKATELTSKLGLADMTEQWQAEWNRHQWARKLYAAARPYLQPDPSFNPSAVQLTSNSEVAGKTTEKLLVGKSSGPIAKPPRLFWLKIPDPWENSGDAAGLRQQAGSKGGNVFNPPPERDWLATRFDDGTNGYWIVCRTAERGSTASRSAQDAGLGGAVSSVLDPDRPASHPVRLPEYFSTSLELAGNTLISRSNLQTIVQSSQGKPSGLRWAPYSGPALPPPILATATKVEDGIEYLRCNVHLISPQMLFARQRQRTAWFGLLIGVSAAAALVGFATARRAFQRQLRLAEMKSNFVSSVSHELRAPIASVRLMAEGLERGRIQDPAKQNEYFRFIVQECRRLSSMIENVLDFSRIEQGRKQYEFEPADLRALVEQTTKVMGAQAAERQIRLETVVTGEPIPAEVDGRAIQQALVNLMDNALKHSPNNSVIRIGLEFPGNEMTSPAAADPGSTDRDRSTQPETWNPKLGTQHSDPLLRLWVEDEGEGIPPEEHERIFERFYRCGSELRRETQGVGIGLSIVKHIVEAHHGHVLVRSGLGQGSRFTIELPSKSIV